MSDQSFRIAVVGAGYTAREHLRAFADIPNLEIVGIMSRTRSRAEALAQEFESTVFDRMSDLAATKPDLLIIAVTEDAMREVTEMACQYSWALLVEKPPGFDLSDAVRLQTAVLAQGSQVYVGLNRQFLSSTQALLDDLKSTEGNRFVQVQDQQDLATAVTLGRPPHVHRNWMYAASIHTIDYFRMVVPAEATRVQVLRPWDFSNPTIVLAYLEFGSGDAGVYEAVWNAPGPWAVTMSAGGKRWELRPLERAETVTQGRAKKTIPMSSWDETFKPGFRLQAENVRAAVLGESNQAVTLDDALRTMRLIARIYAP